MENKYWILILIGIIILICGAFIFSAVIKFPVTVKEVYISTESYQTTTYENYVVSAKNCQYASSCSCIHRTFWTNTCDSCKCQRQIEITKQRPVTKQRDKTIYCTILEDLMEECKL